MRKQKSELTFNLGLGLNYASQIVKNVELLRTNGAAEKVFTEKLPSKPYTWYGNVISMATKSIGDFQIGQAVRDEYLKNESVNIPDEVHALYFADANSMIVEIHRRSWQNLIPEQKIMCQFCPKHRVMDIDLNRIEYHKEDLDFFRDNEGMETIIIDLEEGFYFRSPTTGTVENPGNYDSYNGKLVNRLIYRIPTLGDAIRNEEVADDSIQFWRQIAFDCMIGMYCVDEEDESKVIEIPRDVNALMGMKLYSTELCSRDLRNIREGLREAIPTLPFAYEEDCGCPQHKQIPVVMEASNFFGE